MMYHTFHVYRAFKFHLREVWQCPLPAEVATSLQTNDFETLKYMFSEVPHYVFTKQAIPFLANRFLVWWNIHVPPEFRPIRDNILAIIEAYPASYHHAATQELGIGFGIGPPGWKQWPTWKWNMVGELGVVTHDGLSDDEIRSRKKNGNGRPSGVPDELWRKL